MSQSSLRNKRLPQRANTGDLPKTPKVCNTDEDEE